MMFSESRNDGHRSIGDHAPADCLKDCNNTAGIGNNYAEIGDDATGIVDIAVKVTPS